MSLPGEKLQAERQCQESDAQNSCMQRKAQIARVEDPADHLLRDHGIGPAISFEHHPELGPAHGTIKCAPTLEEQNQTHTQYEDASHLGRKCDVPRQSNHEGENGQPRKAATARNAYLRLLFDVLKHGDEPRLLRDLQLVHKLKQKRYGAAPRAIELSFLLSP
jgi:hypothetical protein